MIDSDEASLQHEEAVLHHAEPYVAFAIASIGELIFIQYDLAVVLDWVVLAKHVYRQVLLRGQVPANLRLDLLLLRDGLLKLL